MLHDHAPTTEATALVPPRGRRGAGTARLRVGILAPPWVSVPPRGYGGTESFLDRLARGLARAGHEVRLWTTGESTCPVPRGWSYETDQIEQIGNTAVELRHVLDGYDWLLSEGCDVIHDHTLAGPLIAPDVPVITTNHGPFGESALTTIYRAVQHRVPIISISRDQASAAHEHGIDVAHIIHHGIDVDEVPFGDGQGDERGPYLLFLGRMCAAKGVLEAIHVANDAGARLVIAAKMNEQLEIDFFRTHVEPLCHGDVEYIGEVGGERKQELLGRATALLNPIQWPEPFGLVMIESLATGTPVITTRRGAAPEIVEHGRTGTVCDSHDELVDAVRRIDMLDRAECRASARHRFNTDLMVERHLWAYRRLLGARSGAHHLAAGT